MSSESDDEDFAAYGSALDPIDEDAVPNKKAVSIEDQVAKDKYGRRRFHGAFTGGFSAGFFNTVGSLEGWTPSQFKSSRSSKSKYDYSKRPEDFMDEEDMDEFGIAPKILRPTEEYKPYDTGSSRKRALMQMSDGPIPGTPVLCTLLQPQRETIGIKLLMEMGWRPGQGVGPRLSQPDRLHSNRRVKMYGCSLPDDNKEPSETAEEICDEDSLEMNVTFAPDDYEPYVVKPKNDCFGLGYSGLDRRPVLSSHINLFEPSISSLVMQEKKKKVNIKGQAFGVGAFEREDEDIYAKEDMSQYDFALDTPQMLAEKRLQEKNKRLSILPSVSDTVEGFVASSLPEVQKRYPPPPLPQGFTPHHQTRQSKFSGGGGAAANTASQPPRLTARERSVIVNESEQSRPPPQAREEPKTQELDKIVDAPTSSFRPFVADPDKQLRYEKYVSLSKQGQSDKLKSLQPLTMTEWERERERAEFEQAARLYKPLFSDRFVSASQPDDATDPLVPVAKTSDADAELRKAVKMKMYGRLTRRVEEWQPHHILCKRFNIPQPHTTSSSSNTKTSRPKFSVFNFLDAATFNAPTSKESCSMPAVDRCDDGALTPATTVSDIASATTNTLGSSSLREDVTETGSSEDTLVIVKETTTTAASEMPSVSTSSLSTDVLQNNEEKLDAANKVDLYKSIFLSSSEESDGEEESTSTLTTADATKKPTAMDLNVLRNTSPPRGIFANVDFDRLKPQEKKVPVITSEENTENKVESSQNSHFSELKLNSSDETDKNIASKESVISKKTSAANDSMEGSPPKENLVYGPSLPMNISATRVSNRANSKPNSSSESESEDQWVEVTKTSDSDKSSRHSKKKNSKKSHRKSKKHKDKRHKQKKNKH